MTYYTPSGEPREQGLPQEKLRREFRAIQDAFTAVSSDIGGGSGDMSKSTYDTNADGKVNAADAADSVPWSGVTDKPTVFPPDTHSHSYIPTSEKGAANGVAPLGADQKIASTYLPSYVDDVVEVANYAALPGAGETGKIYTTLDNNKIYRWSGSAYVEISPSPGSTDSVTEGSSNLYFTAARVRDVVLTGLSTATNAVIAATDSVLVAFGKLQAQISALVSGKQDSLVSGTNIKTINGASILGSGNMAIASGGSVLLGTLSTASGTSATLSNIDLTPYKFLKGYFSGLSRSSNGNISINSVSFMTVISGASNYKGWFEIDLATGNAVCIAGELATFTTGVAYTTTTTVANATTELTIAPNLDGGSFRFYGVP